LSKDDALPILKRVAEAVRADDAEAARKLLAAENWCDVGSPFEVFVASVLLGVAIAPPETEPANLQALFLESSRLDLVRLTDAVRRMAKVPEAEQPRIEIGSILIAGGEAHWAELAMLPAYHCAASGLFLRVLSGIWVVLGRHEKAFEAARNACIAAPDIADHHIHYAGILLNRGEPGLALLAVGRAIGCDARSAIAWRFASAAYLSLGLTAEAIEASRQAATLSQDEAAYAEEVLVSVAARRLAPSLSQDGSQQHSALRAARPAWADAAIPPRLRHPRLWEVLRTKLRLIDALILREARGLFTHSRLGYAWALCEPLTHVFILMVAMTFFTGHGNPPIIGDNWAEFYMTGVLPYLMFCHLTEQGMDLARSQRIVLALPSVKLADVMLSSLSLRAATDVVVIIISLTVFAVIGMGTYPKDPLEFTLAFVFVFLLGFGVAGINVGLSTFGAVSERAWPIVLRAAYFLSGIFYHPSAMPTELRDLVLWNPLVHLIEWVRQSYYPQYRSPYLDMEYLMTVTVLSLLFGTLAAASVSRWVRLHR
jgi:capsular polysaccharide transport system permease protein